MQVQQLLDELKDFGKQKFLSTYAKEIQSAFKEKYGVKDFETDIDLYFSSEEVQDGSSLIIDMLKLSGAKRIDLSEFNYFQYKTGFYQAIERDFNEKHNSKFFPAFKLFTNLFRWDHNERIFGLTILDDVASIQGFVDTKSVNDGATEAISMLSELKIIKSNKLLFTNDGWNDFGAVDSFKVEIYKIARDKIYISIKEAMEKEMALLLCTL
ncbi:MAG: hypothetical protein AABX38_06530 [Candidatus Micrarchaeota archaeon]